MVKIREFLHGFIIRFIAWYMYEQCGGASHVYPYGNKGRYVVIMNERQYHDFRHKVE